MQEATIKVTVDLPEDVWNRVETAAEAEGVTPAEILARLAADVFAAGLYKDDPDNPDGEETDGGPAYYDLGSPI